MIEFIISGEIEVIIVMIHGIVIIIMRVIVIKLTFDRLKNKYVEYNLFVINNK